MQPHRSMPLAKGSWAVGEGGGSVVDIGRPVAWGMEAWTGKAKKNIKEASKKRRRA